MVAVRDEDYLYFVDRALRHVADIVAELGDELACVRPDVPGANSAYALLTHCLAVIEYWVGEVDLGRDAHRDRDAEFAATGPVGPLLARTDAVLGQLAHDLPRIDGAEPPVCPPAGWADHPEVRRSQGRVLLHVHAEIAQHLGQLEVLRDVLLADRSPRVKG